MARSLYRLIHCIPDGGHEAWGFYDDEKQAIKDLVANYKKYIGSATQRKKDEKDFRDRYFKKHGKKWRQRRYISPWWWVIQRLGYVKPNEVVDEFHLPWKTIYVVYRGRDRW